MESDDLTVSDLLVSRDLPRPCYLPIPPTVKRIGCDWMEQFLAKRIEFQVPQNPCQGYLNSSLHLHSILLIWSCSRATVK